jgi:hypothetical protein
MCLALVPRIIHLPYKKERLYGQTKAPVQDTFSERTLDGLYAHLLLKKNRMYIYIYINTGRQPFGSRGAAWVGWLAGLFACVFTWLAVCLLVRVLACVFVCGLHYAV